MDKPAENCPSKGSLYVREGRCSHQRIHNQTQRHLASSYLHSLFLPVFAARLESKHTHAQKALDTFLNFDLLFLVFAATPCFFPVVRVFL